MAVRVVDGVAVRVVDVVAVRVVGGVAVRVVDGVWRCGSGMVGCTMLVVGVVRMLLRLKCRVVRVQ